MQLRTNSSKPTVKKKKSTIFISLLILYTATSQGYGNYEVKIPSV